MTRLIAKNPASWLPTLGLSLAILFGLASWNARRRADALGVSGWAALFGARQRFEPVDLEPKPVARASLISFPEPERAARFSTIAANLPGRPAPRFLLDDRPTVTVYLAPWSTYCRDELERVRRMREALSARDVATRIVIGLDSQDRLDELARDIGGDVSFEPGGQTSNPARGVPAFVVSAKSRVLGARVGGFSTDGEAPAWVLGRLR